MLSIIIYLKKLNFVIDEDEFYFQLNSHPYYPSLLSVSDTLQHFFIDSKSFIVNNNERINLPENFFAPIVNIDNTLSYSYVENYNNYLILYDENLKKGERYEPDEFAKVHFNSVILIIINGNTIQKSIDFKFGNVKLIKEIIVLIVFLSILYVYFNTNSFNWVIIYCINVIGVFLSYNIFLYQNGKGTALTKKICDPNLMMSSCGKILNSKKLKLFKYVNFTELSIFFFLAQSFTILFGLNFSTIFFYLLLFISIPFVLFSVYFQAFIEKNWCKMCLLISMLLISELILLLFNLPNKIVLHTLTLSNFLYAILILLLVLLQKSLILVFQQKEQFYKIASLNLKLSKNYNLFKLALIASRKIKLINSEVKFLESNNDHCKINLLLITSPYCGFCIDLVKTIRNILEKFSDQVHIDICILQNPKNLKNTKDINDLFLNSYYKNGFKSLISAMLRSNAEDLHLTSQLPQNLKDYSTILNDQYNWCIQNQISHTPTLFINNSLYPVMYGYENLYYFVQEMLDDSNFDV